MEVTASLEPVSPAERIVAIDVLRGFALLGVLLAYTLWNLGSPPEDTYSNTDRILNGLLSILVDTKFYTLFAFLFGLGFSIQLTRAEARGVSIVRTYCRRLIALLLIGLVHALLLRNGDILVPYAVTGLLLIPFRNAPSKVLFLGAIGGLLFPYVARSLWNLTGVPFPVHPETEGVSYLVGNFAWVRYWYATAIVSWPASLPMFLFGLYVGRRRYFENLASCRKALWLTLIGGLATGILAFVLRESMSGASALLTSPFARRLIAGLLWSAHAWGLAAFYASSLLLLVQQKRWRQLLKPLGDVGRMALTNYLLQAVIIVPVCIAFDLFDRITPTLGVVLAAVVWSLQVPLSVLWLKRWRFGPAEWVWRSMTYGRPQAMHLVTSEAARSSSAGH